MSAALVQLIMYAALAATVAGMYGAWHHKVYVEGENDGKAAQVKIDKPTIDNLTLDRDQWHDQVGGLQSDNTSLSHKVQELSEANVANAKQAQMAKDNTKAVLAQMDKHDAADKQEIARLKARAGSPKNEAGDDAILDDLVQRRGMRAH